MKKFLKQIWKLLLLLIFLAAAFSYAMFQGGFVSWFLFYSFFPFALYALLLVFYPLKSFSVERSFSKTELAAGEEVVVKLTLTRKIPYFPLFYIVVEDLFSGGTTSMLKNGSKKMIVYPWFKRKIELEYKIEFLPRGEHTFHSLILKTSDPFALIEKETAIPVADQILVYPFYENIFPRVHSSSDDQATVSSSERSLRDTTMATGVREYQPGDRFSWINWKATARRNRMMTKEFEQRRSFDVLVVMDCTPSANFEAVVSFTASVIRGMLREGLQVGLLTNQAGEERFPVSGGESHEREIFRYFARVEADGDIPLEQLAAEEHSPGKNAILMLVTSQEPRTNMLPEKAVRQLYNHGNVYIFIVRDENEPGEMRPSFKEKGVNIISVRTGHFAEAFSEVKTR